MKRNITIGLSIALVIVISVFSVVNAEAVRLNLLFGTINISLALIIILSTVFGVLISFSYFALDRHKKNARIKELQEELNRQQQLIDNNRENLEILS